MPYKSPVTGFQYNNVFTDQGRSNHRVDDNLGKAMSPYVYNDTPYGGYNWLEGLFDPQKKQDYEFAQQMFSTDYQNWWNSAPEQMARMKEAGINPNTAAAGIAGTDTGSVASPPNTAQGQEANALNALSGLASAANGGLSTFSQMRLNASQTKANDAKALLDEANARNVDRLADAEILQKAGVAAQALTNSGIPEIAAMEIALNVSRNGLNGVSALLKGDNVCRMIDQQQNLIEAQYSAQWKQIEALEKEIELKKGIIAEQDYKVQIADVEKKKQDLSLWRDQQTNEMWKRFDGDPYFDLYQHMANIRLKYGEDSRQYQAILRQAKDMVYNQELGRFTADQETAFERFRNQLQGSETGKMVNAKFFAELDNYKTLFSAICDLYLNSNGSLDGLAHRIISLISSEIGMDTKEFKKMFEDAFLKDYK